MPTTDNPSRPPTRQEWTAPLCCSTHLSAAQLVLDVVDGVHGRLDGVAERGPVRILELEPRVAIHVTACRPSTHHQRHAGDSQGSVCGSRLSVRATPERVSC